MIHTKNAGINTAIAEVKKMSLSERMRARYEAHLKEIRDRNAREDYVRSQGVEIGRQEGRQEGKAWAQYEAIENLMDSLNLSVEEAMEALKIPESDREQITQKLAQKFV